MKSNSAIRKGVSILAGGLAFVGTADATELIVDGSFENTEASSNPVVRVGGKPDPGIGGGWSTFSTYLYSTLYTLMGALNSGIQYLRPYPSGTYGITQSSQVVTQMVSLTATTTLTPAKIDSGVGRYSLAAWFSSYRTQGDYSDMTLEFLDENGNVIESISLGGQEFVANIATGENTKYNDAKEWAKDLREGTIPQGARTARVTMGSTGSGAPDGYVDLVSLDVVDAGIATPTVTSAAPGNNAVNVGPVVNIGVTLQDRSTSVDTNSIRLRLDNNLVTPTSIEKVETNTLVRFAAGLLPAKSAHTYSISFSDNGSPPTNQTNQYRFTVADYLTLSPALRSQIGSEDTTKPGFNVTVYQVDAIPASDDPMIPPQKEIPGSISFSEAVLAGNAGPNVATLSGAEQGNTFAVPGTIDWATSAGATANFPGNEPFPGIPGTSGSETSFVDDIRTFVRFPTAGYYEMGINNEDQFRLTGGTNLHQVLRITEPANTPLIPAVALGTNVTQVQFAGALPLTNLTAEIVYATPSEDPNDACNITGTTLQGKIALLDRGGDACDNAAKAAKAQAAGAVAVLMITPGDVGFPFRLDDVSSAVNIPVLVIAEAFGGTSLKTTLKAGTKVTAQISGDPAQRLVEWDGPKGFGAVDVTFGFAVTEPGIYPFRLIAGQEGGNANLEWFTIQPDGTRILVNDVSNAAALRTFRARTQAAAQAQLSVVKATGGMTISWTGTGSLEETTTLSTNWTNSSSQANPQTVPTTGSGKYFRIRQ